MTTKEFDSLTEEGTKELIQDFVNILCDNADMKDLLRLYADEQLSFLNSLEKEELLSFASDYGILED